MMRQEQLGGIYHIALKDMKTYYLKPPAISWGMVFPLAWTLAFYLRSPGDFSELVPGLLAIEVFEAQTLLNLPRFFMVFLCGVVYPVSALPEGLQLLARLLPLTYTVQGLQASFFSERKFCDLAGLCHPAHILDFVFAASCPAAAQEVQVNVPSIQKRRVEERGIILLMRLQKSEASGKW